MSDADLERALRGLRDEYLADSPRRVAELWTTLARVQSGERRALDWLRTLAHRLAGSGGGYGLPEVTDTARALDLHCRALLEPDAAAIRPTDVNRLRDLIQLVADAFSRALAPE